MSNQNLFIKYFYSKTTKCKLFTQMKNVKNGFSPWHTKQTSFDSDHNQLANILTVQDAPTKKQGLSYVKKSARKSSKLKTTQRESNQESKIIRSYSKTQSLAFPKESEQKFNLTQRKFNQRAQSGKKSQKSRRQNSQTTNEGIKLFEEQKWKILTLASNDKFRNENSEIRKYQKFVEQLKSRRSKVPAEKPFSTINVQTMREKTSEQENTLNSKTMNSPQVLQEVSVKNFIIHGHYTDAQFLPFQQCVKRRDINFALKQKFNSARKNPNMKQNQKHSATGQTRKQVLIRGKSNKDRENLFNVIKLERDINNRADSNKIR